MTSTTLTDTNARDFWQARYADGNTPWDRGSVSPALTAWLGAGEIAPPATALVPGCGRGHEVLELARRGFAVTAVDLSASALEELEAGLHRESLSAELAVADLLEWEPDAPFDIIYEQTCLCALLPRYWMDYESRLHRWLKPDASLAALFLQSGKTDGPPFHCSLADMRRLFAPARWQWPTRPPERIPRQRPEIFEYAVILHRA